uniref:(California timema) hypothetical protein n=2 Tax=Timema TaxID=61471 RepID=A0A7R9J9U0_TIMCA|nr:unnamed protein product [Timema californicum]
MDEVLFHISQHLEALQVYLNSSIQHGRLMLQTSSDHTRAFFTEVWSGQQAANLREGAELLYLWLAERAGEVKRLAEELIQPQRFLRQIQHLLENDRTQTTWLTTLRTPVLGNVFPQTDNLAHNSPDSCVGECIPSDRQPGSQLSGLLCWGMYSLRQTTWLTTLRTPVLGNVFPQTDNLAHNSPDSCVGECIPSDRQPGSQLSGLLCWGMYSLRQTTWLTTLRTPVLGNVFPQTDNLAHNSPDSCVGECIPSDRQPGSQLSGLLCWGMYSLRQTTWLTTLRTPVLGNVFPQTDNLAHNSPDSCVGDCIPSDGQLGSFVGFAAVTDIVFLVTVSRTGLYFGGLGFLFGGLFGVMLGLSWYRPPPPTQRMRAVVCTGYYGPDSLATVDDLPVPTISSPDQILVQVKAASVDTVDSKICCGYGRVLRKQLYAHSYVSVDENVTEIVKQACVVCSKNARHNFNFPVILGRDCSGIIIEIGQKVKNFEVGDEVWFGAPFWSSGTMCECVVVKENMVAKKPRGVGFEVAASLPYTGTVAWNAMVRQAGLNAASTAGKRILVHGGSSPVGCILIQLATLWGGSVATTCSSRATPVAQALGAEEVIVTGRGNVEKQLEVRESFDMIFNTVEGSLSHEACLRFCRPGGHVVTTFPSHVASDSYSFLLRPTYNLWLRIKVTAHSSQLTPDLLLGLSPWGDLVPSPATLDQLAALVEDGSLQPVVDKIFSPQDAELAFQHAGSDEAIGKTVIRFSPGSVGDLSLAWFTLDMFFVVM